MRRRSFTTRLTLALALLLLAYGVLVGLLGRHVADEHAEEALQRLSHGLARNIVEHWPEIVPPRSLRSLPPEGALACGPAKPVPRLFLVKARRLSWRWLPAAARMLTTLRRGRRCCRC